MVVPLYISEISPPEIRGTLLVLEELSIVLGIVVSFWITYGTQFMRSHWSWQLPFLLQIVPGLFLGFGAILLPFSPRWLAFKGREQEALRTLATLRCLPATDARVRREWLEIIAESRFHQGVLADRHGSLVGSGGALAKLKLEFASWSDCFKKGCWRRTHVGAGLMFFQQVSGVAPGAKGCRGPGELTLAYLVYRHQRPHLLQPYPVWVSRPRSPPRQRVRRIACACADERTRRPA